MAEWQNNELAGQTGIAYVVSMHENLERQDPVPENLDRWKSEIGFNAHAAVLDYGRAVIDAYIEANPGPRYTEAVTVIIDKNMRIRRVGGTYDLDHEVNLALMQELLAEE